MSLVTISAPYGAGGSKVGPELATRLGARFVDRVVPSQVAARLGVAVSHVDTGTMGHLGRLLMFLAPAGQDYDLRATSAVEPLTDRSFRQLAEQVVCEFARSGNAVILGRAGAVVLRDDARALHVRLDGPREARLQQAMRLESIARGTAEQRMKDTDRARYAYVHHYRRIDARDPTLYHLIIDSTVIELTACVELIALAAEAHATRSPPALEHEFPEPVS